MELALWLRALARLAACCAIPVALAQGAGPPLPFEDHGACPYEGCVYREWIATAEVKVRASRDDAAPVVFQLKQGDAVTAVTGVVVTSRAGLARVATPQRLATNTPSNPLHVLPGQDLYLLTYQGEGWSKVWFDGRLYDSVDLSRLAGCQRTGVRPCVGEVLEQPQRVWWVQIRTRSGQLGWTRETDKFGGRQALGG